MGSKQPSKPFVLSLLLVVVHFRVVGILKASEIPLYSEWEIYLYSCILILFCFILCLLLKIPHALYYFHMLFMSG